MVDSQEKIPYLNVDDYCRQLLSTLVLGFRFKDIKVRKTLGFTDVCI